MWICWLISEYGHTGKVVTFLVLEKFVLCILMSCDLKALTYSCGSGLLSSALWPPQRSRLKEKVVPSRQSLTQGVLRGEDLQIKRKMPTTTKRCIGKYLGQFHHFIWKKPLIQKHVLARGCNWQWSSDRTWAFWLCTQSSSKWCCLVRRIYFFFLP